MTTPNPDEENDDTFSVCSHENGEDVIEQLVNQNISLAKFWANRYTVTIGDYDECLSRAMKGLMSAAKTFDASLGVPFSSYAHRLIKNSLNRVLTGRRAKKRGSGIAPLSLHALAGEDQELIEKVAAVNTDATSEMDEYARKHHLAKALSGLSGREKDILRRRFGIGCETETLEEIAKDYKCTRERIRQIEESALEKASIRARNHESNLEKIVREAHEERLQKECQITNLYPFQVELSRSTVDALSEHSRVVMTLPTGGGKTATCVHGVLPHMVEPILWITHRRELVSQARRELMSGGIPADVRTIQSFQKGAKDYRTVVIDEGHHVCADQYLALFEMFPEAKFLALTATPYRLDGIGLGSCGFSKLVIGPDIFELTQQGFLTAATVLVPENEECGAWPVDRAAREIQKYKKDIFAAIAYLPRVSDAEEICQELNQRGMVARSIHTKTAASARRSQSEEFKTGRIKVLCNHTIYTEGYDAPNANCVVLNRLTQSRCLWKQMVGRGLRVQAGKTDCLIMDLAGNALIHGSIYDREIYDLTGMVESTESRECPSVDRGPLSLRYSKAQNLKLWKPKISTVELRSSLLRRRSASPWQRFVTAS